MLRKEVYSESYGIMDIKVVDCYPPLYKIGNRLVGSIISTDPYITDTTFPTGANNVSMESYTNLAQEILKQNNSKYLLIKTRNPDFAKMMQNSGFTVVEYSTSLLDIDREEKEIWENSLTGKTRNQVRKGYKCNPQIVRGKSELIKDYFQVIAKTQTDLGTPVHSIHFYKNICDKEEGSLIIIIYFDKRPVSATLTINSGRVIFHPYTGTINKFKPLSINNVLYWEIIKYGLEIKCHTFDMGRSIKGSDNERYKRSWGASEISVYYCYYLNKKKSMPSFDSKKMKLLTWSWRTFMPVCIAKKIGHFFIRWIP